MTTRLSRNFARFCIVGTVGFGADAGSLYLIMAVAEADPYIARIFSFIIAATVTWALNRTYTFNVTYTERLIREWVRYLGYASVGGVINYSAYVLILVFFDAAKDYPVIGVAVGSIAGLGFNYVATRYIVFRGAT